MNRQPYTKPPRAWTAKSSRFWMGLWRPFRLFQQVKNERILRIDVEGLEHVHRAIRRRDGILITPNHPGHADCYLLWEALTRLPRRCYVMTAWQVFQMGSRFERLVWRQHGCFSIDREGVDLRAYRFAVHVLAQTSHPLVIFPEGDVYHLNERVTPFRDGISSIVNSAVKQGQRPVSCVPCALKYEYVRDPTPQLREVMARLEQKLGLVVMPEMPLDRRIHRFAGAAIAHKERQYLGSETAGTLAERFMRLADHVLSSQETQYGLPVGRGIVPERVKSLRRKLIDLQLQTPPHDSRQVVIAKQMDDLFFATQLYSYYGDEGDDYVAQRPTVERMAETIDKFEEDFLGASTAGVRGLRRAMIAFDEPIVISRLSDRRNGRDLSRELEDRVQALLDRLASRHQAITLSLPATAALPEPAR